MVGLRWWNYINDAGESEWIFESKNSENSFSASSTEVFIFWTGLVAAPLLWVE